MLQLAAAAPGLFMPLLVLLLKMILLKILEIIIVIILIIVHVATLPQRPRLNQLASTLPRPCRHPPRPVGLDLRVGHQRAPARLGREADLLKP